MVFVVVRRSNSSLYDLEDPEFLTDMGVTNPLNDDNIIFKTGNRFIYKLVISDKTGPKQLSMRKSLSGPQPVLVPAATVRLEYTIDHIALEVFRNKGETSLGETQTIIKYDFYDGQKKVFVGEKTGVIEDSNRIFIHPPRSHFFYSNQLTPFPYVLLPIDEHTTWEMLFDIPEHTEKKYPFLTDHTLQLTYSMIGRKEVSTPWGLDTIYQFKAIAKNSQITTSCDYYFSEDYGFVKIEFHNLDGVVIRMDIEDIKKKSTHDRAIQ